MNLRKLDHVSFLVRDVERSLRFYSQVLGLRGIPRPRNAGAWLTNDEHSFEVHLHLHTLNVEIVGGPRQRGDGVQQVFICDPDGYLIELFVRER